MAIAKGSELLIPHIHREYLEKNFSEIAIKDLLFRICNEGFVLPQIRVGNQWHMPCCWLGSTSHTLFAPESEEGKTALRQRFGWKRLPYLLILPYPSALDIHSKTPLNTATTGGRLLRDELIKAGIDLKDVMVTYVARFGLPSTVKSYSELHKTACLPYLMHDINMIKPSVIIACGADALKALYGRSAKLDTYRGNVLEYKDAKVIPTISYLAFLSTDANIEAFRNELRKAKNIRDGVVCTVAVEKDYRVCSSVTDVEKLCSDIRKASPEFIAFDTEFGNDVAREEFSYTLSVQLSWGANTAAFVKLRDQIPQDPYCQIWFSGKGDKNGVKKPKCKLIQPGPLCGQKIHSPEDETKIWSMLQELFLDKRWKLAGHHLRVDVDQFARNGYPIDDRIEDGICTMLIHHLLYGDEHQGLDHLVHKFMPEFGGYWTELEQWLSKNGSRRNLQFGYRNIPMDILVPYGLRDAEVTWLLAKKLTGMLKEQPTLERLYWEQSAPTSLHLLDVERKGILIDEDKRREMFEQYQPVYDEILAKLRRAINWPSFNPNSSDDKPALLFSKTIYSKKKTAPEGARVFAFEPLVNTDKYPREWSVIREAGEEKINTPATSAPVLDIMTHKYPGTPEIKWLKQLSVIGTFLKNYLRPQELNEFGVPTDGKGFANNIYADGRVRTHLSQLTQTGRYTSQKANLQTKPKKQEAAAFEALVDHKFGISEKEYVKRIDRNYTGADRIPLEQAIVTPKFASAFITTEDRVLIEADFKTAELRIWAFLSGDKDLMEVVLYRDLHSEIASSSYNLYPVEDIQEYIQQLKIGNRKPYDDWCEDLKKKYGALRVGAKSINFGVIYGRSARALTTEINKVVDKPVTLDQTQHIINNLAKRFPLGWRWLHSNADKAVRNEYIENAFGRKRYFQGANRLSESDKAAIRREAKNSPIQGTVAELLAKAGIQFYRFLNRTEVGKKIDIDIVLPIHDAFLFDVARRDLVKAYKIIEMCMASGNKLPGSDHYLEVDIEIFPHRWSDKGFKTPEEFLKVYPL